MEGTHREGERKRDGLELMVLHLPGSMSIMAVITLNKESISLFSFLLHALQQKHRRRLKSFSNAVCLHVIDTSICSQLDQNKMTLEVYADDNPLSIDISFRLHSNNVQIMTDQYDRSISEIRRNKFGEKGCSYLYFVHTIQSGETCTCAANLHLFSAATDHRLHKYVIIVNTQRKRNDTTSRHSTTV